MSTSCCWDGKGRYGSFRLRVKRIVSRQVKLYYPLTMRVIPERLSDYLYILPLPLHLNV